MAGRERIVDRGTRLGRAALGRIGQELRDARLDRGLSLRAVATAAGISESELSRIERGRAPWVPVVTLFRSAALVGLELSLRTFPGSGPLRDDAHRRLLADFVQHVHRATRRSFEVPLPLAGDRRAWDALLAGSDWRIGVEAETVVRDGQALLRRLQLKRRDGGVDGLLLVVRSTRTNREAISAGQLNRDPFFDVPGSRALELLRAGLSPGGNALIVLPSRPRSA